MRLLGMGNGEINALIDKHDDAQRVREKSNRSCRDMQYVLRAGGGVMYVYWRGVV